MDAGWVRDDLVPDALWCRVAPLLPARPGRRSRNAGRLPLDDRGALAGIVYVLKTGVSWREVPREVAGCSGVTCWRRLRDWTEAGVWPESGLWEVIGCSTVQDRDMAGERSRVGGRSYMR